MSGYNISLIKDSLHQTQTPLALVDCNNFFVSCERVFDPTLRERPVVVASNNDGCIVARSNEAKKIGLPMGAPLFKHRDLVNKHKVIIKSSNFALYSDLSKRVMQTIRSFTENIEVYSVDEAFIKLPLTTYHGPELRDEINKKSAQIRQRVYQWIGIPVSIGIAPTKTLCKISSDFAKKGLGDREGVFEMFTLGEKDLNNLLREYEVGDIWGVGRQMTEKLHSHKIKNALELKYQDPTFIKKLFGVVGSRILLELNGISTHGIEVSKDGKKGISSTRMFGRKVTKFKELEEAITYHITLACEKLRRQNCVAQFVTVNIKTKRYSSDGYFSPTARMKLDFPSLDTRDFVKKAIEGLRTIYNPRLEYSKCGVYISGISPTKDSQMTIFEKSEEDTNLERQRERKIHVMNAIDMTNKKWGSGTIRIASEGFKHGWESKRELISKRFTTKWEELCEVE